MSLPTNDPYVLDRLGECNLTCSDCARSICPTPSHQPWTCICNHPRLAHSGFHPHACTDCDCASLLYITPIMIAKAVMRLVAEID